MDNGLMRSCFFPMAPEPTGLAVVGRLRLPVKCLLCDIYGTLLISGSGDIGVSRRQVPRDRVLENLVDEFGIELPPAALRRKLFEAIENVHREKEADGIAHPEVEIDKIWAQILPFADAKRIRSFAIRWEMAVNPVWPMPGLTDLIKACRNRGIALGIISNAQFFTPMLFKWLLDADLAALGFDHRLILLSFRFGVAKPSETLFSAATDRLQAMGISPAQAAFIGNDMRNDIVPAHRAGFQTVLFGGDARSLRMRSDDPACRTVAPDLQITHLSQLVRLLDVSSTDKG